MSSRDPRDFDGARAASIVAGTGHTVTQLLDLEGLGSAGDCAVYLSGSLVEGLGHRGSDVDIFVIGERRPCGPYVLHKGLFSISIHYAGSRRVDFEYWPAQQIAALAARLARIRVGEEFVAEKLAPSEELFIHRLHCGLPLLNPEAHRALKSTMSLEHFRAYLLQQAIHRIDGASEDVVGMLDDARLDDGVLRARDLVGLAADALGHWLGNTNTLPKWRGAILRRLLQSASEPSVREIGAEFWQLNFPGTAKWILESVPARDYMRRCIAYSERVVERVQT